MIGLLKDLCADTTNSSSGMVLNVKKDFLKAHSQGAERVLAHSQLAGEPRDQHRKDVVGALHALDQLERQHAFSRLGLSNERLAVVAREKTSVVQVPDAGRLVRAVHVAANLAASQVLNQIAEHHNPRWLDEFKLGEVEVDTRGASVSIIGQSLPDEAVHRVSVELSGQPNVQPIAAKDAEQDQSPLEGFAAVRKLPVERAARCRRDSPIKIVVGAIGFEPTTLWSQSSARNKR